jgi:hypothetical protein
MSACTSATSPMYTTAISESAIIIHASWREASGRIGSEKRTKPYAPSLSRMAASTTEPPVGASVWASGSQVCTGHMGTLTAKANRKAKNSHSCAPSESGSLCQSRIWKLPPDLL